MSSCFGSTLLILYSCVLCIKSCMLDRKVIELSIAYYMPFNRPGVDLIDLMFVPWDQNCFAGC